MRGLMSRFSFKQSKSFVFPTSCVLTSQSTDVRKLSNKRHADGVPFARFARFLLPHFAFGKTGRTGAPQPLPCRGEGVIAPGFVRNRGRI